MDMSQLGLFYPDSTYTLVKHYPIEGDTTSSLPYIANRISPDKTFSGKTISAKNQRQHKLIFLKKKNKLLEDSRPPSSEAIYKFLFAFFHQLTFSTCFFQAKVDEGDTNSRCGSFPLEILLIVTEDFVLIQESSRLLSFEEKETL